LRFLWYAFPPLSWCYLLRHMLRKIQKAITIKMILNTPPGNENTLFKNNQPILPRSVGMMKFNYKWTLKDAVFTKDKGKVFSCFACLLVYYMYICGI
jgi:hypothetical protein